MEGIRMNIFVTDRDPVKSAQCLPDKHVVKMPLESCQMLAIVASKEWGHGFGKLPKIDGTSYLTEKGAFRYEYTHRYGKIHSCQHTLEHAAQIFPQSSGETTPFARAMPDEYKYDSSIDTITAYKRYIASKPWAASNYLRDPSRKPNWL